ncbi:FkbM family methyltransferase [Sinorhizobium medicae]|uniref:FkbM family methyltransferase n=1 Tax=Sinorhizobium medicae TaxID=110321 RepID=UPI000FD78001|nr:FkbM family methyltransferase [Sinorhizobium medicae]MDX0413862.1 FkbM family methyltransferase [Sinorhizobium medicae]MDX0446294.1 FkbM family methyltransferase [Sinorhizobium medicae]MDX0474905.1 FkbM family methyltransferase [Sinorhizobium medicae]MDX0659939.1 FkbM family methyltransferase [Sinorhizobium medicae]MDX0974738.1 FkbM family methyltransferase [Sinorhizobium medicae]
MPKKIYIDLGANKGDTIASFLADNPDHEAWGFEANPLMVERLNKRFSGTHVAIIEAAVWTSNGNRPMFLGHPLSSTLVKGKKKVPQAPHFEIDYQKSVIVRTVDFSEWLRNLVGPGDTVTVKMDIEGAEYQVLQHLLETGAIDLIDELRCEFHQDRFPISKQRDQRIRDAVSKRTKLVHWN